MKPFFAILAFFFVTFLSEAQVSLTLLNDYKLTPTTIDTSGVFCRAFYHSGRNKFYVVYASRSLNSPPEFNQYYRWEEYDANFNTTGVRGTLSGQGNGAGDYAMTMVGNSYYHVTGTGMTAWQYKLSKYDEDFNLVNSVTFAIDSSDSKADMLLNYTNGKLIIGAFHETGTYHPTMPQQTTAWTPQMHKWEFDTSLVQIGSSVYLNEMFTAWGGSCIYNSDKYNIVTFSKWLGHGNPTFNFNVYRYDSTWNYIDTKPINTDGQWSQGVLWDGSYYYVAYHSGRIHRGGNITIGMYDINWNLAYDTTITSNQIFDTINSLPTLNTVQHNANRPYLTKVNDTLYVSYDEDDYVCSGYSPVPLYNEGKRWQAHVAKLKINGLTTGVIDFSKKALLDMYPNPANTMLNIKNIETGSSIRIIDVNGRKVIEINNSSANKVNIEHLKNGIYFVNLISKEGKFANGKFVKQ